MSVLSARIVSCFALGLLGAAEAHAAVYNMNLTTGVGSPTTVNGAIFQADRVNAGSGTYTRMFGVEEQAKDSNNPLPNNSAQAYNDAIKNNFPFNQKTGNGFTPALTVGMLPVVGINGVPYLQFLADYNGSSLTIAELKIYASATAGLDIDFYSQLPTLGTVVYDLDAGGDNSINVTGIPSGSGYSDMSYNIPLSFFEGKPDNIYVFIRFDNQVGGGYQEIAYDRGGTFFSTTLPEARTVWGGLSIGLFLCAQVLRKRLNWFKKPAEAPTAA